MLDLRSEYFPSQFAAKEDGIKIDKQNTEMLPIRVYTMPFPFRHIDFAELRGTVQSKNTRFKIAVITTIGDQIRRLAYAIAVIIRLTDPLQRSWARMMIRNLAEKRSYLFKCPIWRWCSVTRIWTITLAVNKYPPLIFAFIPHVITTCRLHSPHFALATVNDRCFCSRDTVDGRHPFTENLPPDENSKCQQKHRAHANKST